jgi:kynureninase
MVDTVASLGCMPFEMDKWGIDVAMSGSQKGLMTPPGLGFVAANDRAREVHKKANLRTPYWDWTEREGSEHYRKYAGTAPVHLLFALRKAIDMLHVEGLENAFLRHRLLAEAVRRAVAAWSEGQVLGFNIAEANERSNTVTTVTMNGFDPAALQRYCKEKCGVVLGTGIGDLSGQAFRIAHMGHVNAPMILGTLGVIEVGLNALNIPHGKGGTEAAIEYLGRVWGVSPIHISRRWVERSETPSSWERCCGWMVRLALTIPREPNGLRLSQCEVVVNGSRAGRLSFLAQLPFPIPFLSVYWYTKPGADPCKTKSGSEAIWRRWICVA